MRSVSAMMSAGRQDWETPPAFFAKLHREFGFTLDVCASPENAKCGRFFGREENGLAQAWGGVCWCNPPYGNAIAKWVRKAYWSARRDGATVVCLIPARTDTSWWHTYCLDAEVRFVRGRLKFVGAPHNAPFPSAVVIFRPGARA